MNRDPAEHLARGLAWGLLASESWTQDGLHAAAARTFGSRHRWLRSVVARVLDAYREPPRDRPEELARFLLAATPLAQHAGRARRRGHPVRVRVVATVPGRMGTRRWPVPEVADLAELAKLLELPLDQLSWAADVRGLQRRTPSGPLHLYRHRWVARPGAVARLLEAPTPLLRAVQRRILDRILVWVPLHPAAHGFVRGRSALTNARVHGTAIRTSGLISRAVLVGSNRSTRSGAAASGRSSTPSSGPRDSCRPPESATFPRICNR